MSFVLHEGNGPEPFSTPPEVTWQTTWDYWDTLFDLLIAFAHADQPELAELAQEALPNVLARYTLFGHMTKGLARFRQVAQECLDKRIPVSVSRLSEALIHVQKAVTHRQVESAEGEESLQQVKKEIADIVRLLEVGDFSTRLVRWASTWASDEQGEHMNELRALAAEALGQPHLLTAQLLIWLLSGEAKLGLRFFLLLGELDTQHFWLPVVEELGGTIQGAGAFAWYFSGLGVGERSFVDRRLDELTREGQVTGQAIIAATAHFPGDSLSAKRVRLLLEAKRAASSDVEYVLLRFHPWLRTLNLNDYLDLLKVTAEEDLKHAQVVVNSLIVWLYHHPKMSKKLAAFAQQCLACVFPNSLEDASYCDQLASKLVEIDVEIGFTLFEQRLHRLALATLWNPLSPYTGSSFWDTLCQANRKRALRAPLVLATNDHSLRTLITGSLVECIDQELDATTLIEFASEQREHAWVVCESIAASKAAFWPLALEIFRHYSSDEEVTGRLHYAVRRTDIPRGVLMGLPGVALQSRLLEVQRVLSEMPLSARERIWVQEIERFVQAEKEAFERFESDIERQRIPLVEDDPSASERLWMLKRVMRNGKLNTLKRSISKEELLALLPALQLSEQERMQFEGQITKWE
jgi:hypothetical protein